MAIKAYSREWYDSIRPSATINMEKKIIDNKLLGVMNT